MVSIDVQACLQAAPKEIAMHHPSARYSGAKPKSVGHAQCTELHGIGFDQMHVKSEIPLVIPCKFSAVLTRYDTPAHTWQQANRWLITGESRGYELGQSVVRSAEAQSCEFIKDTHAKFLGNSAAPIFYLNAYACATDTRAHADLGATRGKIGGIRLAPRGPIVWRPPEPS